MSTFTHSPVSTPFLLTPSTYLSLHPSPLHLHLAVGALVFSSSWPPRILLLQRSATDSMPLLWEIPGGACEISDESVLHSVARELKEETGLTALHIRAPEEAEELEHFTTSSGKKVGKVSMFVDVREEREVVLDPAEHQRFVWATKEEVLEREVGSERLIFTSEGQERTVREAFQRRSEGRS